MAARENLSFTERNEKRAKQIEAEAGLAFERLMRTRKLRIEDRVTIARSLYQFAETVFSVNPELQRGEFAQNAELTSDSEKSSKELWRLTLAPEEQNSEKLRASGRNYALLIKAIAKVLKRNLHLLTDEVTFGTTVHPDKFTYQDSDQRLLAAIQRIANEADECGELLQKFRLIAKAKNKLLLSGGLVDWPFDDLAEPFSEEEMEQIRLRSSTDEGHSYWLNKGNTEVNPESIAQLPHVHLGMYWSEESGDPANYWGSVWGLDNYTQEYQDALRQFNEEYVDIAQESYMKKREEYLSTDLYKNKTLLDAVPRKVVIDEQTGLPMYEYEYGLMANMDYWLVLYPNKEMTAIEPVLWCHGGEFTEGMMYMQAFTLRTLNEMKEISVISGENETLYDRLLQLLQPSGSESALSCNLLDEWTKTSPYIKSSLIWKDVQREIDLNKTLDRFFN